MDLETFKRRRLIALDQAPRLRMKCRKCLQPDFSCFCEWLKPVDPHIHFVILTHPVEFRRRIATGRLSHLSLLNSTLLVGEDFSQNDKLNDILDNPNFYRVMLYPGRQSVNLTPMSTAEKQNLIPSRKKLAVVVIDGTWGTARRMVRLSQNIKALPRICFFPPTPSNFRVRRQPRPECYSTIEAIHHTIDLLGPACGYSGRDHDHLLFVFDKMVRRQIDLTHAGRHAISSFLAG